MKQLMVENCRNCNTFHCEADYNKSSTAKHYCEFREIFIHTLPPEWNCMKNANGALEQLPVHGLFFPRPPNCIWFEEKSAISNQYFPIFGRFTTICLPCCVHPVDWECGNGIMMVFFSCAENISGAVDMLSIRKKLITWLQCLFLFCGRLFFILRKEKHLLLMMMIIARDGLSAAYRTH